MRLIRSIDRASYVGSICLFWPWSIFLLGLACCSGFLLEVFVGFPLAVYVGPFGDNFGTILVVSGTPKLLKAVPKRY